MLASGDVPVWLALQGSPGKSLLVRPGISPGNVGLQYP
jgi:hypothetical protein